MAKIERVFDRVKKSESKRRSWHYGEGPHGFALCVAEKLDDVTDLVLAEADRLGEPLKRSVVRGGLGAFVNFKIGRR